jgi:hypothetical protein
VHVDWVVAHAFLDNVTTMLLVAPSVIDMYHFGVDPRPYLIGEVILSNIGGTALIGEYLTGTDAIICFSCGLFLTCLPPHLSTNRRTAQYHHRKFLRGDWFRGLLPMFHCVFPLRPSVTSSCPYIYRYYLTSTTMCPRYRKKSSRRRIQSTMNRA